MLVVLDPDGGIEIHQLHQMQKNSTPEKKGRFSVWIAAVMGHSTYQTRFDPDINSTPPRLPLWLCFLFVCFVIYCNLFLSDLYSSLNNRNWYIVELTEPKYSSLLQRCSDLKYLFYFAYNCIRFILSAKIFGTLPICYVCLFVILTLLFRFLS